MFLRSETLKHKGLKLFVLSLVFERNVTKRKTVVVFARFQAIKKIPSMFLGIERPCEMQHLPWKNHSLLVLRKWHENKFQCVMLATFMSSKLWANAKTA